jgi:hypothetical protein
LLLSSNYGNCFMNFLVVEWVSKKFTIYLVYLICYLGLSLIHCRFKILHFQQRTTIAKPTCVGLVSLIVLLSRSYVWILLMALFVMDRSIQNETLILNGPSVCA